VRTANNHPPGWSAVVKLKLKLKAILLILHPKHRPCHTSRSATETLETISQFSLEANTSRPKLIRIYITHSALISNTCVALHYLQTCQTLIERAHNSCAASILGAKDQCVGVIGALGSVYHHARDILDTINPDRWAPRQNLLQQKRQTLDGGDR